MTQEFRFNLILSGSVFVAGPTTEVVANVAWLRKALQCFQWVIEDRSLLNGGDKS